MKHERDLHLPSTPRNDSTLDRQTIHEVYNSARNLHGILERIKAGTARNIAAEPKVPRTAAFVLGSGPSLDEVLPLLKDWKGGIFCSVSHALTLVYHGAPPTHIVMLDPFSGWDAIAGVDWSQYNTKMILQPGVLPDLVENWPNEILLFRQFLGNHDTFYAREQNQMYCERYMAGTNMASGDDRASEFRPLIPTEITVFACSPPLEMFAANVLGYGNIFLTGCDFAYHSGKTRFTGQVPQEDGTWTVDSRPFLEPTPDKDEFTGGQYDDGLGLVLTTNGLYSQESMLYYRKNLMTAIRLSCQNVFDTDRGANTELIKVDAAEVIERQGKGYKRQTKSEIAARTEPYLAGIGCFVLDGPGGKSFVETLNPRAELVGYMKQVRRVYVCNECGAQGISNDDLDHDGENCKTCPTGRLFRFNNIDVAKNMRRIERLIPPVISLVKAPDASSPKLSITKGPAQ